MDFWQIETYDAVFDGNTRDLIWTRVDDVGRFVPALLACLGSFHGPPPAGCISYIAMIAAEKDKISITAYC